MKEQEWHATMVDEVVNVNATRDPQSMTLTMNQEEHLKDLSTQLQFPQTRTQADPRFFTDPNDLTQATQPPHCQVSDEPVRHRIHRSNELGSSVCWCLSFFGCLFRLFRALTSEQHSLTSEQHSTRASSCFLCVVHG
jgi:hypothetical protein